MVNLRSREYWIGLSFQFLLVALFCAWVLSMPVFPSQDGPLHLYCVEVFRQLLGHRTGVYSQTYFINHYLPPYSLYYYGLVVLGKAMSLPMADKLIVCGYFIILLLGLRSLVRAVSGSANWTPLLFLPVLLSWPLMMGFVNYCIAAGFACFAIAVWCRNSTNMSVVPRLQFLFWIGLILLTHPVPWMFVLAFCFFDLALRLLRLWKAKDREAARAISRTFRLDLVASLIGCLGYFYLRSFGTAMPPNDPMPSSSLRARIPQNAFDYLRTRGLTLYSGTHGLPLCYRLGITLVFAGALLIALRYCLPLIRQRRWDWPVIWLLFTLIFLVVLPTIPVNLNGSYFFAWRLLFLLYLCAVIASSAGMERPGRGRFALLGCAIVVSLLNLWLATRLINPQARIIASLKDAPVISSSRPGLAMWPAGAYGPPTLSFNPEHWAAAHYFREHNLVLYNTSWIFVQIIPIKPRPERLPDLDYSYEIRLAQPGVALMKTPEDAAYLLNRVGFVLAMRINTPQSQNPFAEVEGSPTPAPWSAGWTCDAQPDWSLCVPPGEHIP